jgi:hypothetical protein
MRRDVDATVAIQNRRGKGWWIGFETDFTDAEKTDFVPAVGAQLQIHARVRIRRGAGAGASPTRCGCRRRGFCSCECATKFNSD